MVCPELRKKGVCSNGSRCHSSHYLQMCQICSASLESPSSFKAHHLSKKHLARVFLLGLGKDGACQVCSAPCGSTRNTFIEHARGKGHQKLILLNPGVENARYEVESVPKGSKLCDICNICVLHNCWDQHTGGRSHRSAEKFQKLNRKLQEVKQDRHFVEVSGDESGKLDFGVFRPDTPSASLTVEIKLTAPEDVCLVDAQLSSSTKGSGFSRQPAFSFARWTGKLKPNQPRKIGLNFSPRGVSGRFQDRLQLFFKDESINHTFAIVREITATTGNEAELRALAPTEPYVRPKRRIRVEPTDVVKGVKLPAVSAIPYVVTLGRYKIPKHIEQTLSAGSAEQQITRIQQVNFPRKLTVRTYSVHWSTLLWVEEWRMNQDLSRYDLEDARLEASKPYFILPVLGLAEKRPSVILGDNMRVKKKGGPGKWFSGYVHRVELTDVYLHFDSSFHSLRGQSYEVNFTLHRTPLRRMYQAVFVAFNQERLLFPSKEHIESLSQPTERAISGIRLFNRQLETNPLQKLAIASILAQTPGSVPFIVYGPPGTGKTVVTVEAIQQLLARDPKSRILACAPSNSAADLLAERILQQGQAASAILRLNGPSRSIRVLPKKLSPCSRIKGDAFVIPSAPELCTFRVIVATCTSSANLYNMGVPGGHFTHIFIDEAGQALEPEAMIPIRTLAKVGTNVILSGDPKQLGPIVHSEAADSLGLGVSYLDRLIHRDVYHSETSMGKIIVKLTHNFRNHPAILKYPNEMFYDGDLQAHADPTITQSLIKWDHLINPNFPIIFHAISGKDDRESNSPSFFNILEVQAVKEYVQWLREDQRLRLSDEWIGIITPYHAQVAKIRKAINNQDAKKSRPGKIKVGSVEEFQGQERRVIIVSTVRSNKNYIDSDLKRSLGFIASPRRFNVAVTRAQALLIVVGDPTILSLDPLWRNFLNYIHASGGWTNLPKDWPDDEAINDEDFLQRRRADANRAVDELATRMKEMVTTRLADIVHEDGDEAAEDRPWRSEE